MKRTVILFILSHERGQKVQELLAILLGEFSRILGSYSMLHTLHSTRCVYVISQATLLRQAPQRTTRRFLHPLMLRVLRQLVPAQGLECAGARERQMLHINTTPCAG